MEVSVPVVGTTIDSVPNTIMIDRVNPGQLFVPVNILPSYQKQ